jgi:hypothetical protein
MSDVRHEIESAVRNGLAGQPRLGQIRPISAAAQHERPRGNPPQVIDEIEHGDLVDEAQPGRPVGQIGQPAHGPARRSPICGCHARMARAVDRGCARHDPVGDVGMRGGNGQGNRGSE